MKGKLLVTILISMIVVALFAANFFMNLYHYGHYLMMRDGYIFYCVSDDKVQFCDNASIRIMELFGPEHCPGLEMRKSLGLVDPTAMCL